jgi:uncharacterized protein DUF4245
MNRIPAAIAGLALVAVSAGGCGSDDSGDTASDPSTTSASASPSDPTSSSPSDAASPSASDLGDPVPSPIINKAVRAAIRDGFPALIPAGVPAGWTVLTATYDGHGGGVWTISLTDPAGAPVTLMQSTASAADLVARLLPDGQAAGPVKISGTGKWDSYTGTSAGLAKDFSGTGAVVVAPDQDTAVTFAEQLLTAEDAGTGDGG